jgi:uncharacterized membrane protein
MVNWRTILGLVLLLVGVEQLFTLNAVATKAGSSNTFAEIGCAIWIFVGAYLVFRGVTAKKQE